jgi:hypothetical protein
MGASGNCHKQCRKRQARAVEINPRNSEGDAHWAWTAFFGDDDHIATQAEKVAECLLRYASALAKLSHLCSGLIRAERNVETVQAGPRGQIIEPARDRYLAVLNFIDPVALPTAGGRHVFLRKAERNTPNCNVMWSLASLVRIPAELWRL